MLRPVSFAFALALMTACSAADEGATTSASSDELISCGWLMGGTCEKLPSGNWRSPELWGELYLKAQPSSRARRIPIRIMCCR